MDRDETAIEASPTRNAISALRFHGESFAESSPARNAISDLRFPDESIAGSSPGRNAISALRFPDELIAAFSENKNSESSPISALRFPDELIAAFSEKKNAESSPIYDSRFPDESIAAFSEIENSESLASVYKSIFAPKSPSLPSSLSLTPSTSSCGSVVDDGGREAVSAVEHRLRHARLLLEHHELRDRHDRCRAYLRDVAAEIESLRRENAELRSANGEIAKVLGASSLENRRFKGSGSSPTSVMEQNRFRSRNVDRQISLPKSISVRSSGYLQLNQPGPGAGASHGPRVLTPLTAGSNKVYVPAGRSESEALEMDVYSQGTWKTELCNKWQQTGTCPYNTSCRFAHGLSELRPVIRHPRYKTELCRMLLLHGACPYGHRCHFRHTLTNQERLLMINTR